MRLFGGGESRGSGAKATPRIPRVSSGWTQLVKMMRDQDGLRVLDIGSTSSGNINFLTGLGHSVYMANLVDDAADPQWHTGEPDAPFLAKAFLSSSLDFGDRLFDVVLFWDTADYLPSELRQAVVTRLHEVMVTGGQLQPIVRVDAATGK